MTYINIKMTIAYFTELSNIYLNILRIKIDPAVNNFGHLIGQYSKFLQSWAGIEWVSEISREKGAWQQRVI